MRYLDDKLFQFEEYYHYLESSFADIMRIIPLENKPDTFSPRLYEILQSVCSQVEGIVRIMHEECLSKSGTSAAAMYKALNQDGAISCQEVVFKRRPAWKAIRPFSCNFECAFRDAYDDPHANSPYANMPKWWQAYNDSKHKLPDGYRAGSIENTYLALAGLYVLLVMRYHQPANRKNFLKRDFWKSRTPLVLDGYRKRLINNMVVEPPSDIFIPLGLLLPNQNHG